MTIQIKTSTFDGYFIVRSWNDVFSFSLSGYENEFHGMWHDKVVQFLADHPEIDREYLCLGDDDEVAGGMHKRTRKWAKASRCMYIPDNTKTQGRL